MSGEFLAKGGLKTPHAIIGGDSSPAISFVTDKENFQITNSVQNGNQVLDFRMSSTIGYRPVIKSTSPGTASLATATNGKEMAVLLPADNAVAWSTDSGQTFKLFPINPVIANWTDIKYFNKRWYISGANGVRSTTDLITWSTHNFPGLTVTTCWQMQVVNNRLITPFSNNFVYSTAATADSIPVFVGGQSPAWSAGRPYHHIYSIAYNGTTYTGVGNMDIQKVMYSSTDLLTWVGGGPQPNGAGECMAIYYDPTRTTYWALNRDETLWKTVSGSPWQKINDIPATPAKRSPGFGLYADSDVVIVGLSTGMVYYTFDAGAKWMTLQLGSEGICRVQRYGDEYLIATINTLYQAKLSSTDPSVLQITPMGVTTNQPQPTASNSLVRKDYVDTEIAGKIQIQTDALVQKQEQTAAAVKALQDTTLDYGEY